MSDTLFKVYFLEKFNNYFNRKIIGYETIAEYILAVENYFCPTILISFNPADNVSTELIMNDVPFDADYLIITDAENTIISRWFIMESMFTRKGQHLYKLRRDLIYDFKEKLIDAPAFIQKGWLNDTDPFILNPEGMSFNQIKKGETFLKDKTNSAWIVGYIAKNAAASDVSVQVPDKPIEFITLSDLATATGITESTLASILNFDGINTNPAFFTQRVEFRYGSYYSADYLSRGLREKIFMSPDFSSGTYEVVNDSFWQKRLWSLWLSLPQYSSHYLRDAIINNKAAILAQLPSIFGRPYLTAEQYNILQTYADKIIKYNGIFYKLGFSVENSALEEVYGPFTPSAYSSIQTAITNATTAMAGYVNETYANADIFLRPLSYKVFVQMQAISDTSSLVPSAETKVSSSRNTVINQAFDMFCIPYGPALFQSNIGEQEASPDYALSIGTAIALKLDSQLYDLQLLPYCPLIDSFDENGKIDLTALTEDIDFNYIDLVGSNTYVESSYCTAGFEGGIDIAYIDFFLPYDLSEVEDSSFEVLEGDNLISDESLSITSSAPNVIRVYFKGEIRDDRDADRIFVRISVQIHGMAVHKSFILWAKNASFTSKISTSLTAEDSPKIESQCNFYRIVSPNYQGSFDFNLAKNGGSTDYFLAECTYKPYTPYIKVVPQLSLLYGANFGDNRGLICGGDFSLPRFTSAWETFQLNNKNFQNIFNREIQNLNLEQDLALRQQLITGGLGTLTAGAAGAGIGAKAGGVYGAIAGAAVGTAGSGIGFGIDTDMMLTRQREQKSIAIDKYNFQLGNIKALPYTLTKVGAFDINSKIWPFLEYYSCTPEEKNALEQKIIYESMTVMRIEPLGNYIDVFSERHYLKGELIRNEAIAEDNHVFEAIYNELLKGVYI